MPEKETMVKVGSGPQTYAPSLWILLGLFCLRVVGQLLVAISDIRFLPPMETWYSGLIPYPYLLTSQIILIILMAKISLDFSSGNGLFVSSKPIFDGALIFGTVYLTVMILRYVIRMIILPEERWFGGAIPIVFQWVLASFVIVFGLYHLGKLCQINRI